MAKITKNVHQYKVNIPIELMRSLRWKEQTEIQFKTVKTPHGEGIVILPKKEEVLRLR